MYRFLVWFLRGFARIIFRVKVYGLENIPQTGPLVLCSNHKSVVDPYFLMMRFPRKIYYMAKSELFDDHGRLVRWFLYQMGAFPVHRNSGDMESVRHALNHLQNSEVVGIFPQGGCVRSDTLFQPKAGAALIAAKAQVPVLPACIYSHGPVRPFKRVTVRFGRVLSPEQLGFREGSLRESRNASKRIAREVTALLEERF